MTTFQICAFCILAFIMGMVFGISVGLSVEQSRELERKRLAEEERKNNLSKKMSEYYSPELLKMVRYHGFDEEEKDE